MTTVTLSMDETHHIIDGKALYSNRFDKIQNFHSPPDYAPVELNHTAFFINLKGEKVFNRTFNHAFGFYDGIATVSDDLGFFHINQAGQGIHSFRFEWSGNFQENYCVVKDIATQKFFHIDKQANSIYPEQYAYVGDYKYSIAVIVNELGLSTHINNKGHFIHNQFFMELDVYHKGYAIAKDEQGYFHIDKQGIALYSARYQKLEPFYNDRAVAVAHDNTKLIISPIGDIIQIINQKLL